MPNELVVAHLDGSRSAFDLPDALSSQPREDINLIADAIHRECVVRVRAKDAADRGNKRKTLRAGPDVVAWLRPPVYRLISSCIAMKGMHHLYARSVARGRYATGRPQDENPFQLGLMAILAETPKLLNDEERHRIGLSLLYAFRHYVPAEFVNGFISQLSPLTVEKAQHQFEPGFDDWIIERRALDIPPQSIRGAYPEHIERKTKALLASFAESVAGLAGGFEDDP